MPNGTQEKKDTPRPVDASVASHWSWLHAHVTLLGARQIKMWHALIGCAFLMGMSVGLLTLSDRISSRTQAVALPSSIENTAQLAFKNATGASQPAVTSNRVVTTVQDDVPQCQTGSWQNAGCGQGGCPSNKMRQTRTVSPTGCAVNSQCVTNSQCESSGGGDRVLLTFEAESARLSGAMVVRNDASRSGGKYIIYNRQRPKDPYAQADIVFTISQTGEYTFWGMTLALDGLTDSFWIQVDGAPADPFIWYTKPVSPAWRWRQMTKRDGTRDSVFTIRLTAGTHKLSFIGREETGLDSVIITNDLAYKP